MTLELLIASRRRLGAIRAGPLAPFELGVPHSFTAAAAAARPQRWASSWASGSRPRPKPRSAARPLAGGRLRTPRHRRLLRSPPPPPLTALLSSPAQDDSKLPRKALYRQRAHSNPLQDAHFPVPAAPAAVDWASLYPEAFAAAAAAGAPLPAVAFADVGCGFGGLTVRLAEAYPDKLVVGMELRDKVCEYVQRRIAALRVKEPGKFANAACVRANAMKHITHFFERGQLEKLFFLFPDPHFKAANHRRRIVQTTLLAEYAYLLKPGGMVYTITDVEDLGTWMAAKLAAHPLFERVGDAELEGDAAAGLLVGGTEEGQKVARNGGRTWRAVFRRI